MRGFSTRTVTFDKVSTWPSKSGVCPVCGKKAVRKTEFYQTLNPFNTDINGNPKTPTQIRQELQVKVDEWKAKPVYHARCEP